MRASIFFVNSKSVKNQLRVASQTYWRTVKQWWINTPERALDRAYVAALILQSLAPSSRKTHDHISNPFVDHTGARRAIPQGSFEKLLSIMLSILRLRLAEFKVSHSILGHPRASHAELLQRIDDTLKKLKVIDDAIAQTVTQQNSSEWLSRSQSPSNDIDSEPYVVTINVQATKVP
jgi:hypothetical protein